MIITLKGADFSASNIGTLSSWRVTRSLGSGASYVGPTSVDKGAALTATVTLAEGYELGSDGVTVTMGGNVVSATTVSGNTITIRIAAVTGNVVIKVPTVNVSGGEEEEPEIPDTPGTPDTPDDSSIIVANSGATLHEHTGFATGSNYDLVANEDYYCYEYIPVEANTTYQLMYGRACFFFDENKTKVGDRINVTTGVENYQFTTPDGCAYISITFKYEEISPEDVIMTPGKTYAWVEKSTIAVLPVAGEVKTDYGFETTSYKDKAAAGYFSIKDIPVKANTQYRLPYARTSWFLRGDKTGINSINITKTTTDWTFVTPTNTAYISASFNSTETTSDAVVITEYEYVAIG